MKSRHPNMGCRDEKKRNPRLKLTITTHTIANKVNIFNMVRCVMHLVLLLLALAFLSLLPSINSVENTNDLYEVANFAYPSHFNFIFVFVYVVEA